MWIFLENLKELTDKKHLTLKYFWKFSLIIVFNVSTVTGPFCFKLLTNARRLTFY